MPDASVRTLIQEVGREDATFETSLAYIVRRHLILRQICVHKHGFIYSTNCLFVMGALDVAQALNSCSLCLSLPSARITGLGTALLS